MAAARRLRTVETLGISDVPCRVVALAQRWRADFYRRDQNPDLVVTVRAVGPTMRLACAIGWRAVDTAGDRKNLMAAELASCRRDENLIVSARYPLLAGRKTVYAPVGFFDKAPVRMVCRKLPARAWWHPFLRP